MNQLTDQPARAALINLKRVSGDAEAGRLAFVREHALLDERSLIKNARDEGREQGREEAFADGITKGEQGGRAEALRQIAAKLIQATTLDDAAIAAVTGLHVDETAQLRRDT